MGSKPRYSNLINNELPHIYKREDMMNLSGEIDNFYCVNCLYFNEFNVLKKGRIYMCPIAAHSDIFNKRFKKNLELKDADSLDIYRIESWKEVSEFGAKRTPFCKYCDLKHWGHHSPWKPSTKKLKNMYSIRITEKSNEYPLSEGIGVYYG